MLRYTPALNLNARVVLRVLYALRTPAPHAGDRLAKAVTFHKRVLRAHITGMGALGGVLEAKSRTAPCPR